jgi:tRNA threonylcarbamoyladenosine modification (KEOPS) complex  Pcc1 subunit
MSMLTLELTLEYDDPETAHTVYAALEPANNGYVESSLDGCVIRLRTSAPAAGTLRNAADDLMACVKIAEDASGLVGGSAADLDGDALLE